MGWPAFHTRIPSEPFRVPSVQSVYFFPRSPRWTWMVSQPSMDESNQQISLLCLPSLKSLLSPPKCLLECDLTIQLNLNLTCDRGLKVPLLQTLRVVSVTLNERLGRFALLGFTAFWVSYYLAHLPNGRFVSIL